MDLSSRKGAVKGSIVAGSVWETRMKNDEVKGGIKVFNADENGNIIEDNNNGGNKRVLLKKGQSVVGVGVNNGKRKTWKNESFEGKNQIRVATKGGSLGSCKDSSFSPVQVKKGISEGTRELSKSVDGIERSPIHLKKSRSEIMERKSVQLLRKTKSDQSSVGNGKRNDGNEKVLVLDDQKKGNHVSIEENEKNESEFEFESESEENCKELGVCQEMAISSNGNIINSSHEESADGDDDVCVEDEEEFSEDEEEIEEIGNEKKSFEIKEMHVPEKKLPETKPEKAVNEVKKVSQFHNKNTHFTSIVNKQPPLSVKSITSAYKSPAKVAKSSPSSDGYHYQDIPQTQNNWQNLVDLVMWRDVSKSTLVFGMGTFIIISTSYTQDLNISCISVMSYMCLVYLAAISIYRSLICRGVVDIDESSYVVGEEEVFWLLKLVLPYLNEFLIKLRALFSGDPATTMKLAVLLFVLARCGSSITIWKMTKLVLTASVFFGVFIVPKVCSAYSHQLTAYGKFWVRRFRDAWDSCTHKKAVAIAIFTLVWNLCSIVARIWAAFMLFVALRYYQQKIVTDDWVEDEAGPSSKEPIGRRRQGLPPRVEVTEGS